MVIMKTEVTFVSVAKLSLINKNKFDLQGHFQSYSAILLRKLQYIFPIVYKAFFYIYNMFLYIV